MVRSSGLSGRLLGGYDVEATTLGSMFVVGRRGCQRQRWTVVDFGWFSVTLPRQEPHDDYQVSSMRWLDQEAYDLSNSHDLLVPIPSQEKSCGS